MFHIHDYIHGLLSHYFKNKEMDELYASVGIRALAQSIIQIFIPVYLYKIGFSIPLIALYLLIFYMSGLFFMYFSMKFNYLWGLKKVMALGTILLIVYYFLLDELSREGVHYSLVAVSLGISMAIYYSSFHLYFTKFSDRKKEASEVSIIRILFRFAAIVGPVIGALLITRTSFSVLFLVVSILLFLSVLPLFLTGDKKVRKPNLTFKNVLRSDSKKKGIAYLGEGVLEISGAVLWPFFIFLSVEKVISLGVIISLGSLMTIVFLLFLGRMADKHKNGVLKLGVFSHALTWPLRLIFLSPAGLFIMNFVSGITWMSVMLPFSKIIYEKGRKSKSMQNYFLFREFYLAIGRLFILLIMFFTGSIYWVFIASFFASFLYLPILRD